MKYDIKPYNNEKVKGFYVWNKPTFFVKKDDNRHDEYVQYKKKHGFSPDEMWDLKTNIAIFISPRLKEFRLDIIDLYNYPNCDDCKTEFVENLDKMIFAFDAYLKDDFYVPDEYLEKYKDDGESFAREAYWMDVKEGLNLFAEYFNSFCW